MAVTYPTRRVQIRPTWVEHTTYPDQVDAKTHTEEGNSGQVADTKIIRSDETYRFTERISAFERWHPPSSAPRFPLRTD